MRWTKPIAYLSIALWLTLATRPAVAETHTIPGTPPLPAEIVRPEVVKAPVVVMLHGGAGLDRDQKAAFAKWASWLAQRGITSVIVDSYSGRGLSRFSSRTDMFSFMKMLRDRADDVERVVAWLRKQPWADAGRIALLGQSQGASAAALAALEGGPQLPQILFYPGCDARYFDFAPRPRGFPPSLWLLAGQDTLTPPSTCTAFLARMGGAARTAKVVTFPEATHVFDWQAPERTDFRNNTYRHSATAEAAAREAIAEFLEAHGFMQ